MFEFLPFILIILGVGAFAGVLAGLLGVGGGIVLVPAFFYLFSAFGYASDQLMQLCVATSLATIIVTSVRSVMSHHKKGAVDVDILKSWAPGLGIGALIGMGGARVLATEVLTLVFACLAFAVAAYMGLSKNTWRLGETMPTGLRRAVISPVIGALSVLMGIGGGSFGVPVMTLYGRPIHRAVATAAGFGVAIAVPSVIGFLLAPTPATAPPLTIGLVNIPAFALVIMMTLITAPWGAKLAHKLDPGPLKKIFAVFLAIVAVNMLLKVL